MKKILVTGGAGFVGRHLIKHLLDRGDYVVCVDSLSNETGCADPRAGWPLLKPMDYRNFCFINEDCRAYFNQSKEDDFDYCFHLAAIVGGRLSIEYKPLAVADDLSIDAEYWRWAAKTNPKKTICFSSSAAYPVRFQSEKNFLLLKEDMIDFNSDLGLPDMSYGWSKLTHEFLAGLAYQRHGLRSVIYRPFSGYGEDQDMSYPFPAICQRILKNPDKSVVYVWGTGHQRRDFIYIEDCINSILQTVDKIENADALNLSTGNLVSFIEFAQLAAEIVGYHPEVRGMSDKPTGVFARGGDTTKQRSFGLIPKIDLRTGTKIVLDHLKGIHE